MPPTTCRRLALVAIIAVVWAGLPAARAEPSVAADRAEQILFGDHPPGACAPITDAPAHVRCLLSARYGRSRTALRLVLALYDEMGDVAGSEEETDLDGGYRGTIHLVPALPVGDAEEHLRWILGAQREIEGFLAGLGRRAGAPLSYRHRALAWRFFRSIKRRTPSAYAAAWEVGYNVVGSLNSSAMGVRDTLFHEIFHLNDAAHDGWSRRELGDLVDGIIARCGTDSACLSPYAPTATQVKKTGTYYAFQPDNGDNANEYAAELATRYFIEQRAALRGERPSGVRFKCGPEENRRAWRALADEFFGGVDLVPPCRP